MNWNRLLLGLGVLGAGVAAAWPFRLPAPPAAVSIAPPPTDLPLTQPEFTLQVSPLVDTSPAVGLEPPPPPAAPARKPLRVEAEVSSGEIASTLESLGSPPEMPQMYQALLRPAPGPTQSLSSRRSDADRWARSQRANRGAKEHRIVDGDTLTNLAQRYLGDASRADELFELNRDILANRDLLPVGRRLKIPSRDGSLLTPVEQAGPLQQTSVSIDAPAESSPLRPPF